MPEIGATLREARQRRKVDLMVVEADTKIRARYLAALEEESFDVLPGPTYVKSFLRTYAEYLGLDAKLLVEEYKQRYERPTPQELTPFSTNLGSRRERRRARGPVISPGVVVVICVVLLVATLGAIGKLWPSNDDGERTASEPTPTVSATPAAKKKPSSRKRKRATTPKNVRVQIVPEGPVYVCLESAAGRPLIDKATMQPGKPSRRFTGRRFRVTFGNGQVRMRVGSRSYPVPETRVPLGYEIRPGRSPRRLSDAQRPTCT
jgi:cytoskeletal protein RodZ